MLTKQLTLTDFLDEVKESDLYEQKKDEDFVAYLERMSNYPNFYKFFTKEKNEL